MASNKDLMAEIEGLCAARGTSVPDGLAAMKNGKLMEVLASLQEPTSGDGGQSTPVDGAARPLVAPSPPTVVEPETDVTPPEADSVAPPGPPPAPETVSTLPPVIIAGVDQTRYFVAEGKSITTLSDPKGAFEPILARELPGGRQQLEQLLADGFVTKRV